MADTTEKLDELYELPQCTKRTRTLSPAEYGSVVTVVVGTDTDVRCFYVHKGLLVHYSTYFQNALKDCWVESATNEVKLPDDDPEVFAAFYNWLYTGRLYFELDSNGSLPLGNKLICKIYVFGDARDVPDLCNTAIECLFQKCIQTWSFPSLILEYTWDNTVEDALIRKFLVDFASENYDWTSKQSIDTYPSAFLMGVINTSRVTNNIPGKCNKTKSAFIHQMIREMCSKYHVHPNTTT